MLNTRIDNGVTSQQKFEVQENVLQIARHTMMLVDRERVSPECQISHSGFS